MVAADINNVFFNAGELADIFDVQGIGKIPIMQDDDRILERTDNSALGTELGEGLIFVRAADCPRMPQANERMIITDKNGRKAEWYVRHIVENTGVYEIRLHRRKQEAYG
jgi:hypothetical protein